MECDDLLFSKKRIHLFDNLVPFFRIPDVVTRGKQVGGVDANGEAFGKLRGIQNGSQVFKSISEAGPLPCRIFQRNANCTVISLAKRLVQSGNNPLRSFRLSSPQMRAGMQNQEWQLKRGREGQLLNKRLERLGAIRRRPGAT